jgi:hypothetical protein
VVESAPAHHTPDGPPCGTLQSRRAHRIALSVPLPFRQSQKQTVPIAMVCRRPEAVDPDRAATVGQPCGVPFVRSSRRCRPPASGMSAAGRSPTFRRSSCRPNGSGRPGPTTAAARLSSGNEQLGERLSLLLDPSVSTAARARDSAPHASQGSLVISTLRTKAPTREPTL